MTLFVNLRAGPYGAVCDPYVLEGDGTAVPPTVNSVFWDALPLRVKGRNVLLAAHGFNVSYESGLGSLTRLETALAMQSNEVFLGILWPGDWVIPAINYPFEDGVASHAGALLGSFCNRWLAGANSISFLSHSLGARVVLEAIKGSSRRVRRACITAGAVNSACLTEEYAAAAANCDEIRTLSSKMDTVLEFAYPPGDFLADLLDPDHPPFEPALGRGGPANPYGAWVRPSEIPDAPPYNHSDYFPPGSPPAPGDPTEWMNAAQFMASAFRGQTPVWP